MRNVEDVQEALSILNPEPEEVEEEQPDLDEAIKEELEEVEDEDTEEEDAAELAKELEVITPDEAYTISSLAEAIEIEPAELYEVMVPLSDHGEPMSIGKLKDGYEVLAKENPQLVEQVATLKKAAEETKNGTTPQQQLSQAEFQAQVAIAQIQAEFQATDWNDLEEYDTANAVLQKQKLQDRFNQANNVLQQAGQQRHTEHQTFLNQQLTERNRLIPEWTDGDTRTKEEGKIRQIMLDAGYNDSQISGNTDPISFMLLRELMQLREEKVTSLESVEKVRKAPRVLRNSTKTARANKDKAAKLYTKAQKSGDERDSIAAVRELLEGKLP